MKINISAGLFAAQESKSILTFQKNCLVNESQTVISLIFLFTALVLCPTMCCAGITTNTQ